MTMKTNENEGSMHRGGVALLAAVVLGVGLWWWRALQGGRQGCQ